MKLLILSDSATALSGFGRITRDLATRIATHMSDKIDVATCGYGAPPSSGLPFLSVSHRRSSQKWLGSKRAS